MCVWRPDRADNIRFHDLISRTSGSHLPFGEDFAETGSQENHHLTTYVRAPENGTDYAVNRQYRYVVGRFMRPDPRDGCIKSPQSLNRYAYVKNDPVNRTDPLGLEDGDSTWKIPSGEEHLYKCTGFDSCKETAEKIRDWTMDLIVRYRELDPGSESYSGHVEIWARHKNSLSKCISRFTDDRCGPEDLPPGVPLSRAVDEARRTAPEVTGFSDAVNRGVLVPVAVGVTSGVLISEMMAGFLSWLGSIPVGAADSFTVVADPPEFCEPGECE